MTRPMGLISSIFLGRRRRDAMNRFDFTTRELPECDRDSAFAQRMNSQQRKVYFRCIDLAAGGGFEYQGGSLGGGSMQFHRAGVLDQRISLYVGETDAVNVCFSALHSIGSSIVITQEEQGKLIDFARARMYEDVRALLRLRSGEPLETLEGGCVLRIEDKQAHFTIESSFERIRSHLALVLELCEAVEHFASEVTRRGRTHTGRRS